MDPHSFAYEAMNDSTSWLVRLKRLANPELRLVCFPFAGGGPQSFRCLRSNLPEGVELLAIQPPGRFSRVREQPPTRMPHLVSDCVDALAPLCDRRFAFFGYSLGAVVAFEVCRELRRRDLNSPKHLIACARRAPHLGSDDPIHQLDDKRFIERVQKAYRGIPYGILTEPELTRLLLPALRADFEILANYQYQSLAPLRCDVSVYAGDRDPTLHPEQLDAWQLETAGSCHVELFEGDHFVLENPDLQLRVAAHMTEILSS